MKNKAIVLQQADNDDDLYIVDRLVNCIEPMAGSVLTPVKVSQLISRRDLKVTIHRAKS